MSDEVIWCGVCDEFYSESRIDVLGHISQDHTLGERNEALLTKGGMPEDTHA